MDFVESLRFTKLGQGRVLQQLTKPSSKRLSILPCKISSFLELTLRSWTKGYSAPFPAIW
jgi:hypothetical protein